MFEQIRTQSHSGHGVFAGADRNFLCVLCVSLLLDFEKRELGNLGASSARPTYRIMKGMKTTRFPSRRRPRTEDLARIRRRRWLFFLLSLLVGFGGGLYYGWFLNPVQYVDTSPDRLRADYKADFVLMVAEGYSRHRDLAWARQHLALLGEDPAQVVEEALTHAVMELGYGPDDIRLMRALLQDLRRRDQP